MIPPPAPVPPFGGTAKQPGEGFFWTMTVSFAAAVEPHHSMINRRVAQVVG